MAVVLMGAFVVLLTGAFIVELIRELLQAQGIQSGLIQLGILLVFAWWGWSQLPISIRESIHDLMKRKESHDKD